MSCTGEMIVYQDKRHHADITENSLSTQPECMWMFAKKATKIMLPQSHCEITRITSLVDVANIFASNFSACY